MFVLFFVYLNINVQVFYIYTNILEHLKIRRLSEWLFGWLWFFGTNIIWMKIYTSIFFTYLILLTATLYLRHFDDGFFNHNIVLFWSRWHIILFFLTGTIHCTSSFLKYYMHYLDTYLSLKITYIVVRLFKLVLDHVIYLNCHYIFCSLVAFNSKQRWWFL